MSFPNGSELQAVKTVKYETLDIKRISASREAFVIAMFGTFDRAITISVVNRAVKSISENRKEVFYMKKFIRSIKK
jgi:hypothetical protein